MMALLIGTVSSAIWLVINWDKPAWRVINLTLFVAGITAMILSEVK